jgi:hypothetical protein
MNAFGTEEIGSDSLSSDRAGNVGFTTAERAILTLTFFGLSLWVIFRPIDDVRAMSVPHPIAAEKETSVNVGDGPILLKKWARNLRLKRPAIVRPSIASR